MFSRHQILYSLVLCLLMQKVLSQESPEFAEDYIDEDLPESSVDPESSQPKANNETSDPKQKKQSNFSDNRFTQLFQPRNRNQQNMPSPFFPKYAAKPKPTLPSFIKGTPSIIRASPTTPSPAQNQRFNQGRATTTTQRTTTTRTPNRGLNGNNRRNQIQANNNRQTISSTTAGPVITESSARRRFGGSNGGRRFNANATIPATTNRPNRRF